MRAIRTRLVIQTVAAVVFVAVLAAGSAVWVTATSFRDRASQELTARTTQFAKALDREADAMAATLASETASETLGALVQSLHDQIRGDLGASTHPLVQNARLAVIGHLRQTLRNRGHDRVALYESRGLTAYGTGDRVRLVAGQDDDTARHLAPTGPSALVRFVPHLWVPVPPTAALPTALATSLATDMALAEGPPVHFVTRDGRLALEGVAPLRAWAESPDSYERQSVLVGAILFQEQLGDALLADFADLVGTPVAFYGPEGRRLATSHPGAGPAPERLAPAPARFLTLDTAGGAWYARIAPYRHDGHPVGAIAAFTPRDAVIAHMMDIVLLHGAGLLLALAAAVAFAVITSRRITQPVTAVSRQMREIAATGAFGRRIPVDRRDEIGDLARSFNDMAAALEQADAAARGAEGRYRGLFENAIEGIFQTTVEGRLLAANPAALRLVGYDSVAQLNADGLLADVVWAAPAARNAFLDTLREQGQVTDFEAPMRRRDGSRFTAMMNARLVPLESGGAVVEGMIQDITARKEKEKADQAREAAEAANEAKSRFLANMSHEIRTPLNAVLGLSHLMRRESLTPRQRDHVDKIHAAGTGLLAVIDDILDLSRVEAGRLELDDSDFVLDQVLDHVGSVTGLAAADKNLELLIEVAADVPRHLRGDPARLGQMLLNLVSNAIKFTERGEVVILVTRARADDPRIWLTFTVRDTGIGLDSDTQAGLFEPFAQADGSVTRRHGGTGLGLAICRHLARCMGGTIGVESAPGQGSRFHFTVPLGPGAAPGPADPGRLAGRTALVVDDNATARRILVDQLEQLGLSVRAAASGAEALARLDHQPADVVLFDWSMPGMDGLDLARALARRAPAPARILVTAHGRASLIAEADAVGIHRILTKPVTGARLAEALARALNPDSASAAAVPTTGATPPAGLAGLRVLLAEDNPVNQDVARGLLADAGIQVTVAENGREALEAIARQDFDAVLMDIQMPEMDGLTATRTLRERGCQLPVIAMTAHALEAERRRSLDAGMNDHLAKPVDPDLLFATLARWCRPGGPAPAAPAPDALPRDLAALADVLDPAAGRRNMGGRADRLRRALITFRDDQADLPATLADSDAATLAAHAHRLKSAAGLIGATALAEAAAALEAAPTPDRATALAKALTTLLARLEGLAEPSSPTGIAPPAKLIARLCPLVAEGRAEADQVADQLAASLTGTDHAALAGTLRDQIADLDTDAALATLDRLAAAFQSPPRSAKR